MQRYLLDIFGTRECRWTGSGCQTANDGTTILCSVLKDTHTHGVALIVCKEKVKTMIEWEPISERMIRARFNSKYSKFTIIQCYAPATNVAEEQDKDNWCELLQQTVAKVPQHDMLLIIGDVNAEVGADNTDREQTMGIHGCGEANENGGLLIDFCLNKN